jgi:transposase
MFAGNRNDVTTLEEIVARIERLCGKANCIWVLDYGMVSEENSRFLQEAKRRYLCVVEDAGATLLAHRVRRRPAEMFNELADITLVDVVLPTRNGVTAILLQHLNLCLRSSLEMAQVQ